MEEMKPLDELTPEEIIALAEQIKANEIPYIREDI